MKYIHQGINGVFELAKYEDYLEKERLLLADSIRGSELLSIGRFIPTDPRSFHNSRLEIIRVYTDEKCQQDGEIAIDVKLGLKGPYLGRYFELHYQNVVFFSFNPPRLDDDLLMHEICKENGILTHELQFDNGKGIEISCRTLHFTETIGIEKNNGQLLVSAHYPIIVQKDRAGGEWMKRVRF